MFSCCRANTKSAKLSKKVKNNTKSDAEAVVVNDQGRIIPTINIDTVKTNDFKDENIYLPQNENKAGNVENLTKNDESATDNNGDEDALEMASQDIAENVPLAEAIDCDPDLKPSVVDNLESLVNRLEHLVKRLERSISARELEIANRTFDTVRTQKRASFDLESTELPHLPVESLEKQISLKAGNLNGRIVKLESSLNRINYRHSNSLSGDNSENSQKLEEQHEQQQEKEKSLENIPTVLADFQVLPPTPSITEHPSIPSAPNMSVVGFQDIINGPLSQYLGLSEHIGGDVAKHAQFVKLAFNAQLQYVTLATQCSQPTQEKQMELLKPTSTQISTIQDYREKNRGSIFFNHLSAISESIPALGWVCVSPTPGPHVKEMNDAGQFYTNRVLKEWKDKDAIHVEWARAWIQTLTQLQAYIKQYHTTGLVWSGKGAAPAGSSAPPPPPIGACPPPPPPPAFDIGSLSLDDGGADERSALFAEINQGEAITKNLKKVTADMQTHKNPTLRTGPAPFKPTQFGSSAGGSRPAPTAAKEPVFTRDGKKWLIEYQRNNRNLLVENAEMNNVVYMFKCEGSTLTVKGKVNNIVFDSCKKCSLLFDSVVASVEFVNCQSVQMQVLGFVPTISIDKTDGCQMYLCKESLGVEIVSSKSSEMNVMLPQANGDYTELALPEQFKTTISGQSLKTICVESLG
ncbi:adenylyl cyclase-associated protein 1 isoform X2 [Ceratitis capitata]|uniref:adenylyl cyclase-associated protein 1 isoform X2 n=1 Tax=Ceratitis capitata TaxID=7213 RepID=UPI000A10456F|nr:adenylyl cyclase-associated protein 1 isoform X2 [Ceratitis capitata]